MGWKPFWRSILIWMHLRAGGNHWRSENRIEQSVIQEISWRCRCMKIRIQKIFLSIFGFLLPAIISKSWTLYHLSSIVEAKVMCTTTIRHQVCFYIVCAYNHKQERMSSSYYYEQANKQTFFLLPRQPQSFSGVVI